LSEPAIIKICLSQPASQELPEPDSQELAEPAIVNNCLCLQASQEFPEPAKLRIA
jgi:hypothetical protein